MVKPHFIIAYVLYQANLCTCSSSLIRRTLVNNMGPLRLRRILSESPRAHSSCTNPPTQTPDCIEPSTRTPDHQRKNLFYDCVSGQLGIHQIDKVVSDPNEAVNIRRKVIEARSAVRLTRIGSADMDYSTIRGKNTENVIGMVTIPVGVVGPLKIKGTFLQGETFVPLATTEGALIASVSRGVKAINLSGGAVVRVTSDGMTRGPVVEFESVLEATRFVADWLPANMAALKGVAESTTRHGQLTAIKPVIRGNLVFLRFVFTTGDAMGMNMATVATEAACRFIEESFKGAKVTAVSGNFCSDKKQSLVNAIEGRGKSVTAEAVIPEEVLTKVFRTSAEAVHHVNYVKNWIGSATAGSTSQQNAHFANSIAAIFLATGQDPAQVVESSSGQTITKIRGKDLYIAVTLPSLEVGTVGGGTGLPTQRESLSIMNVEGSGDPVGSHAMKFAEIVASSVLAGELNLLCALATGELGKAHQSLGRSK